MLLFNRKFLVFVIVICCCRLCCGNDASIIDESKRLACGIELKITKENDVYNIISGIDAFGGEIISIRCNANGSDVSIADTAIVKKIKNLTRQLQRANFRMPHLEPVWGFDLNMYRLRIVAGQFELTYSGMISNTEAGDKIAMAIQNEIVKYLALKTK